MRVQPQAQLRLSRFSLKTLWLCIPLCILSIPPTPAIIDEHVIDVGGIQQEYVCKGAPVLVEAVRLEGDFIAEGEVRGDVLGGGLLHDPLEFASVPCFE